MENVLAIEMYPKHKNRFVTFLSVSIIPILVVGFFYAAHKIITTPSEQTVINQQVAQFQEHNEWFEQVVFGNSPKGRAIEGYIIGEGERVLFLFGAIHGNEMGTADLLEQLVKEVQTSPSLLASGTQLVIVPIVNPDGYLDRVDKLNTNEVNLNLNFPTQDWKKYGDGGLFAGDEPFSEVESRIIRDIVIHYRPEVMLSYHARGALVSPEEGEESIALGKWYAEKTGYEYFDEWDYVGTATRWFYEVLNQPAITIELSDYLESDWDINKDAILELIGSKELPL